MSQLLECVANISEGRNPQVIAAIAGRITSVAGVHLLSVDTSSAAHRSVFTFAGPPKLVQEAAFLMAQSALAQIDLRQHTGIHPRVGAVDVVPLIPLRGLTLQQTRNLAFELSQALATLGLPIYHYAQATTQVHRCHLSQIRAGNETGLRQRMQQDPAWLPDAGPADLHPSGGACAVGVRALMLAWNINLAGRLKVARRIARRIRESGDGQQQGIFRGLKALGWHTADFDCVQVSTNVMNIPAAPMKAVYDEIARQALDAQGRVTGSELIGCVPRAALYQVGTALGHSGAQALKVAAAYLGLSAVKAFDPQRHILEHALGLDADLPLQLPE